MANERYLLQEDQTAFFPRFFNLHCRIAKTLYPNVDTKGSKGFPQYPDKTWCVLGKCSHFEKSVLSDRKMHQSAWLCHLWILFHLFHCCMSYFSPPIFLTELCSSGFKSVFPIVSSENTRKNILGWWRLAKLQPSQRASAEALALCELSQRLFIYCRDAGFCREVRKSQCVSSLQRL